MTKLRLEIKIDQAKREEFPTELLLLELYDCMSDFLNSTISAVIENKKQICQLIEIINLFNGIIVNDQ